jgi:hypothetical protein
VAHAPARRRPRRRRRALRRRRHAAENPLPFDSLVRFEEDGPLDLHVLQELVAYGTTGATPTLRIP